MAITETKPISINSKSSTRVTSCGYCSCPLPLSYTTRVFYIEDSLMRLHFCQHVHAFKYEHERRKVPPKRG